MTDAKVEIHAIRVKGEPDDRLSHLDSYTGLVPSAGSVVDETRSAPSIESPQNRPDRQLFVTLPFATFSSHPDQCRGFRTLWRFQFAGNT
jgi:hypothetical protein